MKTFKTMLKTELKLSLRGMDMFIFAICMPVVVIVLLGIIYGDKPAFADAEYTFLQQSFGAVSTIAICAGGLMGLPLVVSDYRNRKILKRLKVTPVKPITILLVEIAIYCIYSLVSLALIYLVAFLFFDFQIMGKLLAVFHIFRVGDVVNVQHWYDGRWNSTKHENRKYRCQYFILSNANFLGCNASL